MALFMAVRSLGKGSLEKGLHARRGRFHASSSLAPRASARLLGADHSGVFPEAITLCPILLPIPAT